MNSTTIQRTTAVGVFDSHADAQRAVQELRGMGFTEAEIGVASRSNQEGTGGIVSDDTANSMAAGAGAGVVAGAGAGALWGLGIALGMLPAIGPVIAGGTLAAIVASTATGAAAAGIVGALIGLGVPEDEAARYEEEFQAGRTIVTVKAPATRFAQAVDIMNRAGARSHQYA